MNISKQTRQLVLIGVILLGFIAIPGGSEKKAVQQKASPTTPARTATAGKATSTVQASRTPTRIVSPTMSHYTATAVTVTLAPTGTRLPPAGNSQPYPGAPLCADGAHESISHDRSQWHSLWDAVRGCHYDHEHGANPFTLAVAAAFPGFDLPALLGNVGIGHTNPSSPTENVHKHGGFKWQVDVAAPLGCRTGFEDGAIAVKAYAIQYHSFGRPDIEHEVRNHSSVAMLALCKADDPGDVGYMYVVQLQEFGQRVTPYQGFILPYPNTFQPQYISPRGPYFTNECVGPDIQLPEGMSNTATIGDCRASLSDHIARNGNVNSIWTSKPTGNGLRPETPKRLQFLFRIRDGYQLLDSSDLTWPFTWKFMCSSDGGVTYNAAMPRCRWNSSTSTIHEVMGDIPAEWDGLAGFDTDPRPGRITAQGFVTRFGDLNLECTAAGGDCYPIKLVSAFVGRYSSELSAEKVSNPTPQNTPERDIYFCNGVPCSETSPGAVPSGWIGSEN